VPILQKFLLFLPLLVPCTKAQTLAITHATLIDVTNGKSQPDTTVVINGNRIVSIAHSTKANPKAGQIVDAKGQYLIPGL
jgi:imidazolonepropionase-like amidohydrolase